MKNDKDRKAEFQVSDRRFWAQDDSILDKAEQPERRFPSYVEELKERTELAEKRLKERLRELDEENEAYRVRLRRDLKKRAEREKTKFLEEFLEIVDNLERALAAAQDNSNSEALQEGVRLNLSLFHSKLKAAGVEPIDPLGQPFDPHQAEAVSTQVVDTPEQDHQVVDVVQRGYRFGDHLLRPARVRVGLYQPQESPQTS